jgi:hypothetical protein
VLNQRGVTLFDALVGRDAELGASFAVPSSVADEPQKETLR